MIQESSHRAGQFLRDADIDDHWADHHITFKGTSSILASLLFVILFSVFGPLTLGVIRPCGPRINS
jgi:hypothetical protein